MRWFFGLIKILITVLIMVLVIHTFFVYSPEIKQGLIKEKAKNQLDKTSGSEGTAYGSKIGIEQLDGNEKSGVVNEQPDTGEKSDNNKLGYADTENKDNQAIAGNKCFLPLKEIYAMEGISLSDKMEGMAVASKLKKTDFDKIMSLAEGGITYDEMKELNKILEERLDKKDVDKLYSILMKNRKLYAEGKLGN